MIVAWLRHLPSVGPEERKQFEDAKRKTLLTLKKSQSHDPNVPLKLMNQSMISDDSDEDLFASTPQKSPPKKTWRQKRASVPIEESQTGSGDGPETEIDSTL
mgnify:CR=1 FL=1